MECSLKPFSARGRPDRSNTGVTPWGHSSLYRSSVMHYEINLPLITNPLLHGEPRGLGASGASGRHLLTLPDYNLCWTKQQKHSLCLHFLLRSWFQAPGGFQRLCGFNRWHHDLYRGEISRLLFQISSRRNTIHSSLYFFFLWLELHKWNDFLSMTEFKWVCADTDVLQGRCCFLYRWLITEGMWTQWSWYLYVVCCMRDGHMQRLQYASLY